MLCSLLHPPSWAGCNEMDFEGKMVEWEVAIQKYELQSKKTFDEDYRCTTVMLHAPLSISEHLNKCPADVREDFRTMKLAIEQYLLSRTRFSGAGDPMEIDQVGQLRWGHGKKGDKGKKGKDGKGKDGKGKDKGKSMGYFSRGGKFGKKSKGDSKGKSKDKGKNS